ncbi:Lrp/AsnC family transcriptional regulator [Halalkalibacter akibai]|uniref:Transcriptional regulator n=1 Tax=Halalkalibacter akibai (strain ATCC 43226 / DSM 21942 / CIP 109018 / JCM 9157 / 1139) TaxID=1236973 RepID=W4QZ76_HALA3|nr:Lrp/AsnC family transcriptional regulator [Halalkalibacter akibai]GAE36963.1 transcriptional regulator [Halalkalibacter akibai JCM 9157]
MSKLDQVDVEILNYLKEHGKRPYTEIAKSLRVSEGTIRSRVKRMLMDEVFEFKIQVNPTKVDLCVQALIGASVKLGKQDETAMKLLQFKEVTYVGSVLGNHQLLIKASFHSNEELGNFINQQIPAIDDITSIDVYVELKQFSENYVAF